MENNEKYVYENTVGGAFSTGWRVMNDSFLYLFLVVIILGFLDAPTGLLNFNVSDHNYNWGQFRFDQMDWGNFEFANPLVVALGTVAIFFVMLAFAYAILVKPVFDFGGDMIFVQAARQQRPDFNKLVSGFRENYFHIILASLLTFALIMMGLFACIVPGIIIACRLVFVSYLVMDQKLDPISAIEKSWRMTRGYGWTIFAMGILSFFILLAGLLLCLVGIFPAIIWIGGSFAALYEGVLRASSPPAELVAETAV